MGAVAASHPEAPARRPGAQWPLPGRSKLKEDIVDLLVEERQGPR